MSRLRDFQEILASSGNFLGRTCWVCNSAGVLDAFLKPLLANWPILLALLGFYVLFRFMGSAKGKGWIGEKAVTWAGLRRLDPAVYRVFDDVYLPRPDGRGTTQVDHVVVSRFGIFVVETKNMKGWIYGSPEQRQWTQVVFRRKTRFQNPLHQNALHVSSLQRFLGLAADRFHSLVFFIGECEFKTPMPDNVRSSGLRDWILDKQEPRLGAGELKAAPKTTGNKTYKSLGPAPGQYAFG